MVNNDPHNRKQPMVLGLIIMFTGFLLALLITGILRANAEDLIEPPHDPMFNNIVFITMTNDYMYVGGDTIIDLYEGSSEGQYAQVWKSNFIQAINNFFSYVPKDQCFIVVASDGASANYMTSIREVLTYVSANFWSGSQDGNYEANDYSGYEDTRSSAGMYNIRYKTRIVKYIPVSPTPTPTNSPSITESLLFYGSPRYGSSPFSSNGYYLFDFIMESVPESVEVELQDNSSLAFAVSNYNVNSPWVNNVILHYSNDSYSNINIYLKGICQTVNVYYLGNALASEDFDLLRQSYSYQEFVNDTRYSYWTTSKGITGMNLYFNYDSFNFVSSSFAFNNQTVSLSPGSMINLFSYGNGTANNPIVQAYRYGLSNSEYTPGGPSPTVAPPTPTEAPHVIINWPSGTPTPTPPFSVPGDFGLGNGSSSQGSLSSGQVSSTLNTFKEYTENNGAFAFLYACTSVIPDEALYFLFILLFVLLLIAVIRLFVHYGG